MRAKITRRLLDSPRAHEAALVWDAGDGACPGFYARHRGGKLSRWRYGFFYRAGTKAHYHAFAEDGGLIQVDVCERLALAPGTSWGPDSARREAERLRSLIRAGHAPHVVREIPTLRVFSERYAREHAEPFKKPSSAAEDRALLRAHLLPEFRETRLDRIDGAAVTRFTQARKGKPVTANRCLALLSHMYTKAAAWGVLPQGSNPVRGVPRYREQRRTRFLNQDEIARLGVAIRELEDEGRQHPDHAVSPFALAALRLLMFTGMRPGEALALRWEDVDLQRGLLLLPDSKTGAKVVRLNPPSAELLSGLPRLGTDSRVFPPRRRLRPALVIMSLLTYSLLL
jgi:integrase